MKNIEWTDYFRVIAVAVGVPAFFTFILWFKWEMKKTFSK